MGRSAPIPTEVAHAKGLPLKAELAEASGRAEAANAVPAPTPPQPSLH
jgi:hypothetical protein